MCTVAIDGDSPCVSPFEICWPQRPSPPSAWASLRPRSLVRSAELDPLGLGGHRDAESRGDADRPISGSAGRRCPRIRVWGVVDCCRIHPAWLRNLPCEEGHRGYDDNSPLTVLPLLPVMLPGRRNQRGDKELRQNANTLSRFHAGYFWDYRYPSARESADPQPLLTHPRAADRIHG